MSVIYYLHWTATDRLHGWQYSSVNRIVTNPLTRWDTYGLRGGIGPMLQVRPCCSGSLLDCCLLVYSFRWRYYMNTLRKSRGDTVLGGWRVVILEVKPTHSRGSLQGSVDPQGAIRWTPRYRLGVSCSRRSSMPTVPGRAFAATVFPGGRAGQNQRLARLGVFPGTFDSREPAAFGGAQLHGQTKRGQVSRSSRAKWVG